MIEKRKLKVGDQVWFEKLGYRYNPNNTEIQQGIITKVGKKYFEVDKCIRARFLIVTGKQDTDWQTSYRIWFSIEDWKNQKYDAEITDYVRNYMRDSFHKLSIEKIREIKEIICAPSKHSKILSDGSKSDGTTS